MPTQVINAGSTVRVIVSPRVIQSTQIVSGYLLITYSDGTFDNAGYIGGNTAPATVYNTAGSSALPGAAVDGFDAMASAIDARLVALGV